MKLFKYTLISIGVIILLVIGGLVALFWDSSFVSPLDESYRPIKLLKTGEIDSVVYYTTTYNVGDTVMVFRNKDSSHYSDAKDIVNNQTGGKPQKAVIVD